MSPHPRPEAVHRYGRRRAALAAALLAALVTTGCGVRLESPPVAEPVPDSLEVVRRTAVSDALLVAERAEGALEQVPRGRERLVAELTRIVVDSESQAAELGGEYDSGLATDDPADTPEASAAEDPTTVPDVVASLDDAAARSRTAAGTTTDGPLARLLASVGAAQTVSATRLAALADVAGPDVVDPRIPEPVGQGRAAQPASPAPEESDGTAGTDEGDEAQDASAEDPADEATPPEGLTVDQLETLVVSEDATGYALRLRAALADGTRRERLLAREEAHLARATAWARLAGIQDTAQDPRRVAYEVPRRTELGDGALVRTLENDLATDYATLVAGTAPGSRGTVVDLLVDAALALDDWDAEPSPFPGLPEQQDEDEGED
ncbi:DUF4439 domain-containing protein [Isoptericola sp. BMS4]|uniref:DUF4439 domain-containing protein n=1 Tax=Isoptericola sp. BMS4 TaxID=2527875 RepID=UPI00141E44BE|nr:DUF4439 domain-containing protein [Isoptericola sp. BMS4]